MGKTVRNFIAGVVGAMVVATIGLAAPTVYSGNYPNGLVITEPGAIVRNADISNPRGVGLIIRAEGVLVDNVVVHGAKSHGILVQASNVTVQNSVIENNVLGTCYPNCGGGWESGVKCQSKDGGAGLVQNVKFLNNTVRNNLGEGFGLRCADILVQGNTVYDNFSFNIYFNSWNVVVERNFVYCTSDTKYYRDGQPAAGIGGQEEGFTNWPKSAHDITVRNNIVYGCKYGYRYGGAGGGIDPGLVRASIYNNTFYQTKNAEISVVYAPAQEGVIIYDNIAKRIQYDGRGAYSYNNLDIKLTGGYRPELFTPESHVAGEINVKDDFFGELRKLFTIGAIDWKGVVDPSTLTPTDTATSTLTPTSTATKTPTPAPSLVVNTKTPTPTFTLTPFPTFTATPECFSGSNFIVCVSQK